MNELNQAQKDAVEHTQGPLLIIAGAGTGKTSVVTKKITHLIQSGQARPDEILSLAFNDKAAAEISDRVGELLETGFVDLWVHTFHAFCERILEKYGLEIGLPDRFKLATETDTWMLMREKLHEFDLNYYKSLGNPSRHLHALIRHFSACKDEMISPQEYLAYAESLQFENGDPNIIEKDRLIELAHAYETYKRIMLENNYLDFSDLIYYTIKLFEQRPNILANLTCKFKFVLVDEFQDVNWSQYKLAKMIAKNAQLTVVGDDDQSIYAFRGASVSNILRFKVDFPEAREIVLTDNYRSGQNILDVSYRVVKNNDPDRLEAKLGINKKLRSANGEKGEVNLNAFANGRDEIKFIAEKILQLRADDPDLTWDDFAVLVRSNSTADEIANSFEKIGIPYEIISARGLYRQPVVVDAMSYLRTIHNYHENDALYRLLNLPTMQVTNNDIRTLTLHANRKNISLFETAKLSVTLGISAEGTAAIDKLLHDIELGMTEARREKPTILLFKFFERSGYLKWLTEAETRNDPDAMRQIFELRQFFNFLDNFEKTAPTATLDLFMKYFSMILDSGDLGEKYRPDDTPESVNLLTVHNAKGLEFKYVFVPWLVEGKFPSYERGGNIEIPVSLIKETLPEGDAHYEEERRLFYVATTRAKRSLYLSYSETYEGRKKTFKPSRFLQEADLTLKKKMTKEALATTPEFDMNIAASHDAKLPIPDKFSYSQIKTYLTCPYQYKLDTILRIQKPRGPYLSFGTTVHDTLQKFYGRLVELNSAGENSLFGMSKPALDNHPKQERVVAPTFDELLRYYEESWVDDWYESKTQKDEYYIQGHRILKKYYEDNTGKWNIPIALEAPFSMHLMGHIITGRIDRIDRTADGKLEIIDYKTGEPKDKLTSDQKDQLLIYQIVARDLPQFSNLGGVGNLKYIYLTDNSELHFLGKETDLEKLTKKIVDAIESIKDRKFVATPSKYNCELCDFKNICEYRMA